VQVRSSLTLTDRSLHLAFEHFELQLTLCTNTALKMIDLNDDTCVMNGFLKSGKKQLEEKSKESQVPQEVAKARL
jgi:hypothetical protein